MSNPVNSLPLQANITNEGQYPAVSTASTLDALKTLNFFMSSDPNKIDPQLKTLFDREAKYIRSAIKAVENPIIQSKYGDTFQSVLSVADVLRQANMDKMTRELLDNLTPDNTDEKLNGFYAKGAKAIQQRAQQ
jgi:hypothetical protein